MKNIIAVTFLIIICKMVYAAGSWTGSGSRQETFSQGLKFGTGITIESVSTTPTLSARSALKGSVVTNVNGLFWKQDNGSTTNWTNVLTKDIQVQSLGSADSSTLKIYAPANQITDLGSSQKYLEMGNDNLLANPDFEHATAGQSWTSGAGTLSNQTTGQAKGLKSLRITLAAQTLNISQTVSTHSSLAGNQAEAVIWAKSTTSTSGGALLFGSKIDGTESAVSVPVVLTSNWQRLSIPFISGSSSQGLFLKSTTGITNDIFVDNAYVKIGEVKQSIKESGFFGSLKWVNTTSCSWSSTSAAFASFSADADCDDNARVARGNVSSNIAAGNAEGQTPQIKFASMPAGTYYIVASGSFNHDTSAANASLYRFNDGTDSTAAVAVYEAASIQVPHIIGTFYYDAPKTNVTINLQVNTQSTGSTVSIAAGAELEFAVYYFPPASTSLYSSLSPGASQIVWRNLANCAPTFTGTDTELNDADCTYAAAEVLGSTVTPTTTGNIALKVPLLKAGQYKISALVPMSSSTIATTCEANLYANGSEIIHSATNSQVTGIDGGTALTLQKVVNITSDISNYEVIVRGTRQQGAGTCSVNAGTSVPIGSLQISIEPISSLITGSFKEVVTTPGVASPEFFTFTFGDAVNTACTAATCAYLNQIGNRVTSVTRNGASEYTANFAKTYTQIKCLPGAVSTGGSVIITGDNTDVNTWSRASSSTVNLSFCGGSVSCLKNTYNVGGHIMCEGY